MSDALYLVLDQGGQSSRALVFDTHGDVIAQARYRIATQQPQPHHVEHDAAEMLLSLRTVIADVIAQLGADAQRIRAAGLACQRSSFVCWRRDDGRALTPVISWQDTRAADLLVPLAAQADTIQHRSGLFLSAHYGASKMRWCLDHLPEVQHAQQQHQLICGPLASFLAHHLCRERPLSADPANAARTLLWNLDTQDWDPQLCALFDIDPALLPPCGHSHHRWGLLQIDALEIPLTIVTGDQSAALFANGLPEANAAYVNVGTGAFIQWPSQQRPQATRQLCSLVYTEHGFAQYVLEGTVNGAATTLNWLAAQHHTSTDTFQLDTWLRDIQTPPLMINSVAGLGSPWWRSDLTPCFIGAADDLPSQAVAVIESIIFMLQTNLEWMCRAGANIDTLYLSGGLSQLDGLCQKLADLSRLPVKRVQHSEATARGLAFLLAGRPLHFDNQPVQGFEPHPNNLLEKRYQQWQQQMPPLDLTPNSR